MTHSKKSKRLRSVDPAQLRCVRGGVLYPAVKLTDAVIGVNVGNAYIKFGDISGEPGAKDG